ncbi:MAG: hypothetical protein E6Q50_01890 [Lysobacter sp.]|nr:MAG: hypothetical protein E6Q50_01890 [Lysobacter sp.]
MTFSVAATSAVAPQDEDPADKPLAQNCQMAPDALPGYDESLPVDSPLRAFSALAEERDSVDKQALEACPGQTGYDPYRVDPTVDEDKSDIGNIPPPAPMVSCPLPSQLTVNGGLRDNYAPPNDPANLTAEIVGMAGSPPSGVWNAFDDPNAERFFGHAIPLNFSGKYLYGTLWVEMKSIPAYAYNDTITLWATGNTNGGWSANVRDIARIDGQSARIALDLGRLRTATGTVLSDVNTSHGLNIFVQDDMSIDNVRLTLSCAPPIDEPRVGVIRTSAGCGEGTSTQHSVFLDNEDNRNANNRWGWIGDTVSNKNTEFRLCAVDGNQFTQAANAGASFALVSLSNTCPPGFVRFDRFHDNEDNRPASWDTAPAGSPTVTVGSKKDTNIAFCVATGGNPRVSNALFPNLGFSYGVFGGRTASRTPWALQTGGVFLDDEDKKNRNQPSTAPTWTSEFVTVGGNTTYYTARIR